MKNEMENSKDSNWAWHTIAAQLKTFPALASSIAAQSSVNTAISCKHYRSTGQPPSLHRHWLSPHWPRAVGDGNVSWRDQHGE